MLNINDLDIYINHALQEHVNHISAYADKKLDEQNLAKYYRANDLIIEFLSNNVQVDKQLDSLDGQRMNAIKTVIGAKPDVLKQVNKDFVAFVDSISVIDFQGVTYYEYLNTKLEERSKKGDIHHFFNRLEAVFSYGAFGRPAYSKYKLTENLKVRTCIYCNRLYAITHYRTDGGNLMNPQLDHWYPQSKYPLLRVSFFNLIPSCDVCNTRIKKAREFKENEHVHPYDESYEPVNFTYILNSLNDPKVVFANDGTPNKVRDTFAYLNIHEMYNAHIPELKDLIKIREAYGKEYIDTLDKTFPGLNIKKEDRYRLAFGVELDPKKFHLSPLSKFKYDILKGLDII